MRFRKLDMSLKDQRQALVDTFINSIYLYDDKVLITFNYKEGTQTITFEEAAQAASKENGSDLDCFTAPENAVKSKISWLFFFWQSLHTFAHLLHTLQKAMNSLHRLHSVYFNEKKRILREEHSRQLAALLCVHLPDGFKEHFTCDFVATGVLFSGVPAALHLPHPACRSRLRSSRSTPTGVCPACGRRCPSGRWRLHGRCCPALT